MAAKSQNDALGVIRVIIKTLLLACAGLLFLAVVSIAAAYIYYVPDFHELTDVKHCDPSDDDALFFVDAMAESKFIAGKRFLISADEGCPDKPQEGLSRRNI